MIKLPIARGNGFGHIQGKTSDLKYLYSKTAKFMRIRKWGKLSDHGGWVDARVSL